MPSTAKLRPNKYRTAAVLALLGASAVSAPKPAGSFIYPTFMARDYGPLKTPYACSFHWFRAQDGRIMGLDVIRSDDTGRLALRVFRQNAAGGLDGWVYEAPADQWAPFVTDRARPAASGNFIGRGDGWIIGSVHDPDSGLDVSFNLDIIPQIPGLGTSSLALGMINLTAEDYPVVQVQGSLTLQGESMIISSPGTTSMHYGDHLPMASYVATVPVSYTPDNRLMLASSTGANLRIGGEILGPGTVIYAYGAGAAPPVSLQVGDFGDPIDIGGGYKLRLRNPRIFSHPYLGVPNVTGIADASLEKSDWFRKTVTPLGPVIFDYRGKDYISTLPKK